jgi:hypothetical protein
LKGVIMVHGVGGAERVGRKVIIRVVVVVLIRRIREVLRS